ncbi:MAG: hypothetical protein R6W99_10940 [Clostridia bacterium]
MNTFFLTEECPGCGINVIFTPELAQVDFNGHRFDNRTNEEDGGN